MQKETKTLVVELNIPIQAKKDVVWNALVNETSIWWRKDALATGADTITFEPKLGGRLFEQKDDGSGLTWYTVQTIRPNEYLLMSGLMDHEWGGPAHTLLSLKLEEEGDTTHLKIVDTYIGNVTEKAAGSFEKGWTMIFAEALKPYVERKQV